MIALTGRWSGASIVLAALVGIGVGGTLGLRIVAAAAGTRPPIQPPGIVLLVPRAASELTIDGELEERAWHEAPARTGPFVHGREPARPYSDARALWRDGTLYLALYAADEDIAAPITAHDQPLWTGDSFQLVFRRGGAEYSIDVSPRGTVTDGQRVAGPSSFDARWESRAKVAVDRDGTVDDPADTDEEWIVEMAIPLAALGMKSTPGERIGFEVRRCDRVRAEGSAPRRICASWGDSRSELVLQ